jgi:hypothetical protein
VTWEFDAELWRWRAEEGGSWFFVSVPFDLADEIDEVSGPKRGFGSVRVEVTVGPVNWRTSLFPSKEHKTYVLPVKAQVRQANKLDEGSVAHVALALCD